MFISYAICTHNEGRAASSLLYQLSGYITKNQIQDQEIVIVDDMSTEAITQMILRRIAETPFTKVYYRRHTGDFSEQKNYLNSLCTGEWILNLDADESMTEQLLEIIPSIINANPEVEAYWLPRVNIVDGLTDEHIKKWNWRVQNLETVNSPVVMWPDPQMRLYKNSPNIKWVNKVHEQLTGYQNYSSFPFEPSFAIFHRKDIKKQEEQNRLYEKMQRST